MSDTNTITAQQDPKVGLVVFDMAGTTVRDTGLVEQSC